MGQVNNTLTISSDNSFCNSSISLNSVVNREYKKVKIDEPHKSSHTPRPCPCECCYVAKVNFWTLFHNFYLWSIMLKKTIWQVLVLFWGRGINFSHQTHAVGSGCVEKKILAGTARIVVAWFSQYSCLKVQNFAIMGQLWHAKFPDWFFF